jgi:putative addiction module killer protein
LSSAEFPARWSKQMKRNFPTAHRRIIQIAKPKNVPYMEHMISVCQTETFQKWFEGLRDRQAQKHILVRVGRLERGHFGDVKPVGEGISELRIKHGPGYRLYLIRREQEVVLLLCGGDKDSQSRDIRAAKQLAKEIE